MISIQKYIPMVIAILITGYCQGCLAQSAVQKGEEDNILEEQKLPDIQLGRAAEVDGHSVKNITSFVFDIREILNRKQYEELGKYLIFPMHVSTDTKSSTPPKEIKTLKEFMAVAHHLEQPAFQKAIFCNESDGIVAYAGKLRWAHGAISFFWGAPADKPTQYRWMITNIDPYHGPRVYLKKHECDK